MKKRIIIDTDMGADDYIATQLAILSNKFEIEGISLVNGNTSMENVKKNIFKTLEMIDKLKDIKVYEGEEYPIKDFKVNTKDNAHGNNGFSDVQYIEVKGQIEEVNAVDWMIKTINENPNKITIVAIGPLTNIAKAIIKNKDFEKNIKEIIIMGGAENFGNITPYAEFNFYNDPEAAKIVFESKIKSKVMIGFNITKKVVFSSKLETLFKNSNIKNAKFIYDITRDSAKLDRKSLKTDGAVMSDAINICYLMNKKVLKLKKCNVKIETNDIEHLAESIVSYNEKTNCKIAVDVNSEKCTDIIFSTIIPELKIKIKEILKNE